MSSYCVGVIAAYLALLRALPTARAFGAAPDTATGRQIGSAELTTAP